MITKPDLTRVKSLNHRFLEGPTNWPTEFPSELQLGFVNAAPLKIVESQFPSNISSRQSSKRAALELRSHKLEPPYKRRSRIAFIAAPVVAHAVPHRQPADFFDAWRISSKQQNPSPLSSRNCLRQPLSTSSYSATSLAPPSLSKKEAQLRIVDPNRTHISSVQRLLTLSKYTLQPLKANPEANYWGYLTECMGKPPRKLGNIDLGLKKAAVETERELVRIEAVKLLDKLITGRQSLLDWLRNFSLSNHGKVPEASVVRLFQNQLHSYTHVIVEIRGQLQNLFVQRIQPSCSAKAMGQRQLSMSLKRVQAFTSDLLVEHYRYKRELERIMLLQESRKLTFECLLRPVVEPADVEVLAFRNPAARPLVGKHALKVPSGISKILKDYEFRVASARGQHLDHTKPTRTSRLPTSQKECIRLMLLYCSAVLGKITEPAIAELGRILAEKEKSTRGNLAERGGLSNTVMTCASRSWIKYRLFLKRLKRFVDEQSSPYRFFPLLTPEQPIRLLNYLGSGGFAEVWEGLHMDTWEIKAIKITELDANFVVHDPEFVLSSTCREVKLQRNLSHPNVVEMKQCFEVSPQILVSVLDLCNGGPLDRYIQACGPIKEHYARKWFVQILRGLEYIHYTGKVVHFDLKPLNILIHNGNLQIADFGLHQPVGPRGQAELDMTDDQNQVGTVWYMPPEHLKAALLRKRSEFDERFDVWSAGIVFYEMLYQRRPFGQTDNVKGLNCNHLAAMIFTEALNGSLYFPNCINFVTDECKEFIKTLLAPVERRPTTQEVLQHPYLIQEIRDLTEACGS